MRILFAGTPQIAVQPLVRLASRHDVKAVLCSPDKASGRGRRVQPSPVKSEAVELGLPVLQPLKLNAELRETVSRLAPQLLVVVAYHKIFRKAFLNLFPKGGINLHPSLLPLYRGPSPIQAAILNGDAEIGVTVQELALEMDAGGIWDQETIPVPENATTQDLIPRVSKLGAELLIRTIERIEGGTGSAVPQDHDKATCCRLIRKEDGRIDWSWSAERIARMVRAYIPWPKAYTTYNGAQLSLLAARAAADGPQAAGRAAEPGTVLGKDPDCGILVKTGRGLLAVEELQLQSKRPMDWKSFLNGHRDFVGTRLGGRA